MKKHLSIGCGKLHEKSTEEIQWINLDKFAEVNPDVVHNMIDRNGFPFDDNTFGHVKAFCCLGQIERNDDFMFVMNEIHRVLKLEGNVWIYLPHKDYQICWHDPFNQRRTNEDHWLGFDETHSQYTCHNHYYGFSPWKDVKVETVNGFLSVWMTKSK